MNAGGVDGAARLRAHIFACGLANVVAFTILMPLSYGIAVVSPFGLRQEDKINFLRGTFTPAHDLGPITVDAVRQYLSGDSFLAQPLVRTMLYAVLLLIPTVSFLRVAAALRRDTVLVDERIVALVFKFAVLFGLANVLAYPMFTQDFWLSVVWGRMIADGHNPYYEYFSTEALAGLPILYFKIRMTYGPLWALLCHLVTALCGRNPVLEFLCFKAVLLIAWVLALVCVRSILASAPAAHRALALCIAGWLPLSVHSSIAEGHNDIVMVSLLILWVLAATSRRDLAAPVALAASALIKYVTAPLAAVELLRAWSCRTYLPRVYPAALVVAAIAGAAVLAVFWQGMAFFDAVTDMRDWSFFTPAHAVSSLAGWLHIPLPLVIVSTFLRLLAGAAAVLSAWRYHQDPTFPNLAELILVVLCAVLFTQVGHVWPWFVVWVTIPAALAMHSDLIWFVIAVALVAPFMGIYWLLAPGWEVLPYGSVAFYVLAAGAMMLLPRGGWVRPAVAHSRW